MHPVAKSLTRRHLVLGGERELVMSSLLVTATLLLTAISYQGLWLCTPIVLFELMALWLFRHMGRRDAWLVQVWLRSNGYRASYGSLPMPSRSS